MPILLVEVINPLFVISIALYVGLGYILTLLMSVTISHWQVVFWFSVVVPCILLMFRARSIWQRTTVEEARSAWRHVLPMLPLLFLVPMFAVELAHPDLQLPHHGDLHVGYAYQLLYGSTPIESVFLAGYPANYYWLYHAYLAVLVSITSLSVPTIGSIVNLLAILSSLLWIAQTLIELRLAKPKTIYLGLLVILVYSSVNMTGIITLLVEIADGEDVLRTLRIMLLDGADGRLHSVFGKVMNIGSMPLAIMFFCTAFYSSVKIVKRRWSPFVLIVISASGIAGLAMQQVATLYIVVALLGGILITALFSLARAKSVSAHVLLAWRELTYSVSPVILGLWLAGSLCLSLPLLVYIQNLSSVNNIGLSISLFNESNLSMLVAALVLVLPFFLFQAAFAWHNGGAVERYVSICGFLGLILTSILEFPDNNQYKGIFFVAILLATSALLILKSLDASSIWILRLCARMTIVAFVVLVFSRIVWVNYFYIQQEHGVQFDFDGIHVVYLAGGKMGAFYWIRDHTPINSVVLYPLQSNKYANTFHERLPYVKKKQKWHTENMPYDERVQRLSLFYSADTNLSDYRRLLEEMQYELPGRSLYAVVDNSELSPQLMGQRGAEAVFAPKGGGTFVYQLNPAAGG